MRSILGDTRIVIKFFIIPKKLKRRWAWGNCRIKQELQEHADDWYMYKKWVDIECLIS